MQLDRKALELTVEIAAVLPTERAESGRTKSGRAHTRPTLGIGPNVATIDDRQARIARPELLPITLPALVAILDARPDRTLVATAETLDIAAWASGPSPLRPIEIVEALDLGLSDRDGPDESDAADHHIAHEPDDFFSPHGPTPIRSIREKGRSCEKKLNRATRASLKSYMLA
jgi:hypothetical protein